MTWWTLRSMYLGPGFNSAALNCVTSAPDHLYVAFAPWMPMRQVITRRYRGIDRACGYWYIWDTPTIVEQQLPGDTDFHLFLLSDLTPNTTYWGYMFAPDGPYGQEIQGPLFHFTTTAVGPTPEPTDDPILFTVGNHKMRTGNRYTFWANSTWYAMTPTLTELMIWKLVEGVMVRQDQLNEPIPPAGTISDADSRCAHDQSFIHCSYFCRVAAPGPDLLRYATFDLSSDSWAIDEEICTPNRGALANATTSLALDNSDIPHVAYTEYAAWWCQFDYRNRLGGVWSAPETAIAIPNKLNQYCSLACDPATQTVHVIAVMNTSQHYYRNRPAPAGPWGALTQLDFASNTPQHSIQAGVEDASVAQVGQDGMIDHWAPWDGLEHDEDLTAPTCTRANIISGRLPAPGLMIVFRDDATHLGYVYRPPLEDWGAQVQLPPTGLIILTAHYAHPDVISCLWNRLGVQNFAFYAFYAPWH